MHYLEVLVADAAYHGDKALTYSALEPVSIGTIVTVPLRAKKVLGVVVREVSQPSFATKQLSDIPNLSSLSDLSLELLKWMRQYYPAPLGVIVQQFLPRQLPKKPVSHVVHDKLAFPELPPLTSEQAAVINQCNSPGTFLLHGETGSGKTRVYIELAKQCLSKGRSAIILTPEIGLTSQLADDFRRVFQTRVIIVHSQLTDVTRQRLWVSLLQQKQPVIVIGARSALFSPLRNLGLIVIDESHETAYKQDQMPYHHASSVAAKLASLHKAQLVLGSATPLVQDYFVAQAKGRLILRMTQTATSTTDKSERSVSVVDLRNRKNFTRRPYLSDQLLEAVDEALKNGEQSLLFLNRRGTARVVFCEECGWQSACPHCDTPLVYHGDKHRMRCHSCEFTAPSPSSCPHCHNSSVVFKSIGTKAIVDEISKIFPSARIMRFDTDNKKNERIEHHYEVIKKGEVDILIGTQTLAKGLDLPKLSVVGVIIADTSLYFPDFSAQERTYQLLSQVVGRVGRGHREGKVIIQTYTPDSPLLASILNRDWDTFYQNELSERKKFLFPPYCYLLKLSCRRASAEAAIRAADTLSAEVRRDGARILVEGPAPAFHEKKQGKYEWQLIVKSKSRDELLRIIHTLPSGWSYDIDPLNLL